MPAYESRFEALYICANACIYSAKPLLRVFPTGFMVPRGKLWSIFLAFAYYRVALLMNGKLIMRFLSFNASKMWSRHSVSKFCFRVTVSSRVGKPSWICLFILESANWSIIFNKLHLLLCHVFIWTSFWINSLRFFTFGYHDLFWRTLIV